MKNWPIIIEPSILSGDFGRLAEEAKRVEASGADGIHIDVMDGHFVPNFALSPKAVAAIHRAAPKLFLDVHIMIYNPFDYIERFVEAGAKRITFHLEATEDVEDTLAFIRRCGVEAGLAFCPETSVSMIPKYLNQCDLILLMTVHPSFGGQAFIADVLEKIKFTREVLDRLGIRESGKVVKNGNIDSTPPFKVQVDGGIDDKTAKQCVNAGANVLVSGTYLFGAPDMKQRIQILRGIK